MFLVIFNPANRKGHTVAATIPTLSILSINVGLPREVEYQGKTVTTSIYKSPVSGRVRVTALNVKGDRQSDLSVHGGVDKAVYVYPSEHYEFWRNELPGMALPWGAFGENLTTLGLDESNMHIGDTLRVGTAEFSIMPSSVRAFRAARATAQASGLPPNVLPCCPGFNTPSTSELESTADTG